MPDRIIERSTDSLGFLFDFPKYGTSFIASVGWDPHGRSIVKALRSRRFGVSASDINALDISIVLSDSEQICSITEYRWLERAEISTIERGFVLRSINNISIMSGGKFNGNNLQASKVIEAYARSNFVSKDCALMELDRRKGFLEKSVMGGNPGSDIVERSTR